MVLSYTHGCDQHGFLLVPPHNFSYWDGPTLSLRGKPSMKKCCRFQTRFLSAAEQGPYKEIVREPLRRIAAARSKRSKRRIIKREKKKHLLGDSSAWRLRKVILMFKLNILHAHALTSAQASLWPCRSSDCTDLVRWLASVRMQHVDTVPSCHMMRQQGPDNE